MNAIGSLRIDSSRSSTTLCRIGADFGTDKSPYSTTWHKHPYTAIYNLLFSSHKYSDIVFGELGVLDNSSMKMWREFFPKAQLYGFEHFPEIIEKAKNDRLPNVRYIAANVKDATSLFEAFNQVEKLFDVLLDDSTHLFEDQIRFVECAIPFLKPGGLLIIEDVFRGWSEARYTDSLKEHLMYFDDPLFIEADHDLAFSGGNTQEPYYDNDKLLVLCRNQRAVSRASVREIEVSRQQQPPANEELTVFGLAKGDNISRG